jgi:hypothetical protein
MNVREKILDLPKQRIVTADKVSMMSDRLITEFNENIYE